MSKIFGTSYPGLPEKGLKRLADRMGGCLAARKWQQNKFFREDFNVLGIVSLNKHFTGLPVEDPTGRFRMVCNGYFVHSLNHSTVIPFRGQEFQAETAGIFLREFRDAPVSALRNLNGVFSLALEDRENKEIILATDRLGIGMLFYHLEGKKLLYASEVKAILEDHALNRKVNWKGWSDMFNLNWVSGNDTLFEDIYCLPPGCMLRFNYLTGAHSLTAYWSEQEIRIDKAMSEEEAYHGCIDKMTRAVGKFSHLRKEIILPLSGGNDSRFLALAMKKGGIRFRAMTTNKDNYDTLDLVNSEKLSDLLDIDRQVVPLTNNLYTKYFLSFLEDVDFMAPGHIWLSPLVNAFPVDCLIYDGYAGGTVLGHNLGIKSLDEIESTLKPEMDSHIFHGLQKKYFGEPYDRIFRPEIYRQLRELSSEAHMKNARQLCDNYYQLAKLYNRSRRGIASYSFTMLNNYVHPVLPFVENDFFDFALSIPNHIRFRYFIFNRIVNEMVPGLDQIQTSRMGIDIGQSPRQQRVIDHPGTIRFIHKLLVRNRLPDEFIQAGELGKWLGEVMSGRKNPFLRARPYLYFCLWYNRYFS
jgi:hypothetical protein